QMSLPWYYLERPARLGLLRAFYISCSLAYPIYFGLNYEKFIPDRAAVLAGERRKLEGDLLSSRK
ncbi:hypothetical protein PENTCL1PPCAC_1118, partial [Pristionchus entomophagus]